MSAMRIMKDDTVKVIAGKDKGKEGKVKKVLAKEHKVVVEGINMVSKHTKPNAQNQQGGIVSQESPIDISNVMLVVKGQPTKVSFKYEENEKNELVKVRVAKKTGEVIK